MKDSKAVSTAVSIALLVGVLVVVLCALVGSALYVGQQQRIKARDKQYADILAQAPCLESICPGYDDGRGQALLDLSSSQLLEAIEQGESRIGLIFRSDEEGIGGSGIIYFAADDQGVPRVVHQTSFSLPGSNLQFVLDILGEPDTLLYVAGCGIGDRVNAHLFYLSRGIEISVEHTTRGRNEEVLTSDTEIQAITYFIPELFESHIRESVQQTMLDSVAYDLPPGVSVDDFVAQLRPWPGLATRPTPTADFCPY